MGKFRPVNISFDEATYKMAKILIEVEAQTLSSIIRTSIREKFEKIEAEYKQFGEVFDPAPAPLPPAQPPAPPPAESGPGWAPWIRRLLK